MELGIPGAPWASDFRVCVRSEGKGIILIGGLYRKSCRPILWEGGHSTRKSFKAAIAAAWPGDASSWHSRVLLAHRRSVGPHRADFEGCADWFGLGELLRTRSTELAMRPRVTRSLRY